MNEAYQVRVFKYGEDWIAEYPDLPGCNGVGDTELEAIESAKISKELWLEVYFEENGTYPVPSESYAKDYSGKFNLRLPVSLHRNLAIRAEEEGVSLNHLCSTLLASSLEKKRPFTVVSYDNSKNTINNQRWSVERRSQSMEYTSHGA